MCKLRNIRSFNSFCAGLWMNLLSEFYAAIFKCNILDRKIFLPFLLKILANFTHLHVFAVCHHPIRRKHHPYYEPAIATILQRSKKINDPTCKHVCIFYSIDLRQTTSMMKQQKLKFDPHSSTSSMNLSRLFWMEQQQ